MLKPSDIADQAIDEVASALAKIRVQRRRANAADAKTLGDNYDELFNEWQKLVLGELKKLDRDPRIKEQMSKLKDLALQLGAVQREMLTVKRAIDGATRVINILGEILKIVARVL